MTRGSPDCDSYVLTVVNKDIRPPLTTVDTRLAFKQAAYGGNSFLQRISPAFSLAYGLRGLFLGNWASALPCSGGALSGRTS